MYRNNNQYNETAFNYSNNNESDMELNPEFDMEEESEFSSNYGTEKFIESENEGDYEYSAEYELEDEFNIEEESDNEDEFFMENEFDNEESEYGQQYESYNDEMETELEYVTNEQELGNWVNEVVVRTNPGLRPVLRTPLGRRAVKQFSKIAFRTLPYIGRKRQGWKRPYQYRRPVYNRPVRPGNRKWQNRRRWGNIPGSPPFFQHINMQQQPQGFPNQDIPQQPQGIPNSNQAQQPQGLQNSNTQPTQGSQHSGPSQEPPIQQDGSFKNFVMDTIKNLSEQIAKGNESILALKNSMTNSAVNNFPAIVQPKTDTPDQPPLPGGQEPKNATTPGKEPSQQDTPTPGEYEWEYNNEYDTETDYEYDNETDGEYDGETDGEYDGETEGEITDSESSFSEETEMELASELLSVNNESELDHFIKFRVLRKAVGRLSKLLKSPQGALLKKALSKIISKALPVIGGAVAGPAGAAVGGAVGSVVASEIFNLELEGLSNEDNEFEIAKAIVRFAGNAAREAEDNETGDPVKDAEHAMIQAARRFAPGLLRRRAYPYNQNPSMNYQYDLNNDNNNMGGGNGRWYRRGNKIIIQDAF